MRCNDGGHLPAAAKCDVTAGDSVTIEEVGGAALCVEGPYYGTGTGPVLVYLSKVDDALTADGSAGWFKIYQNTWTRNPRSFNAISDFWGTNDMVECCGRVTVKIPADIQPGDYLLRAEYIDLNGAIGGIGSNHIITCFQIRVSGSGRASPSTVRFPGAYRDRDPGLYVDIRSSLRSYVAPGPTVYSGGTTKRAGSPCTACETTCTPSVTVTWNPPTPTPTEVCPHLPGHMCGGWAYLGDCYLSCTEGYVCAGGDIYSLACIPIAE
ncbi:hypothetical protein S40293_09950 [Stachybotrys chartarum IBT 40293]|nr:hypothetical protein S40293_09950 [Stachybotrys chartarum IBT 40293]